MFQSLLSEGTRKIKKLLKLLFRVWHLLSNVFLKSYKMIDFIMELIRIHSSIFKFVPFQYGNHREIIMKTSTDNSSFDIENIREKFRGNKKFSEQNH